LFEVVLIAVRKPKQHQTWCHWHVDFM
jgi:hypothetical protein